ncbi:MAG: hypothetical protein Q4C54_04590 [Clostridia bacterium]|nr:hypothetical protein [Clostridia bacterium]
MTDKFLSTFNAISVPSEKIWDSVLNTTDMHFSSDSWAGETEDMRLECDAAVLKPGAEVGQSIIPYFGADANRFFEVFPV